MGFRNDDFAAVLELERQRLADMGAPEKADACAECGQTVWEYPAGGICLCRDCLAAAMEDYIRESAVHTLALFPEDPQRRLAIELLYYILDNLDLNAVLTEYLG